VVGDERGEVEQSAALLRSPAADVVDDQSPHHAGGVRHEPAAIGKDMSLVDGHLQIRFVEKRRRAEPGQRPSSIHLAAGQAMEPGIEDVEQLVSCDRSDRSINRVGSGEECRVHG
jgi:hypothetical protein